MNNLVDFANEFSKNEKIDYFVFGHLHHIKNEEIENGAKIIILGDWINLFSYGIFDGESMKVVKLNEIWYFAIKISFPNLIIILLYQIFVLFIDFLI